jgi:hypothetical protein
VNSSETYSDLPEGARVVFDPGDAIGAACYLDRCERCGLVAHMHFLSPGPRTTDGRPVVVCLACGAWHELAAAAVVIERRVEVSP